MFVHLVVQQRGLRSPAPVRDVAQPGWMKSPPSSSSPAGREVGGGEPGVALGRQVGEEMTAQLVGQV